MGPGKKLVAWAASVLLVTATPTARTWPDVQDTACTPMGTCTGGTADPMPQGRGKCVGPSTGCSGSTGCMCKDMCHFNNGHEDYTYSDQSAVEKAAQRGEVRAVREGEIAGVQCPASTLQQTDAQVCGQGGNIGEDCTLSQTETGVGQCATHPTTEKVQCLNVCDSSYTERDFGRMGSEADRTKYAQKYSDYCGWSTLSMIAIVLLILAIVFGVALLVAFVCWSRRRKRAPSAHRGLEYPQPVHTPQPPPEVPMPPVGLGEIAQPPPQNPVQYMQVAQQAPNVQYLPQPASFPGRPLPQVSNGYGTPTYTSNYSTAGAYPYQAGQYQALQTHPGTTPVFATHMR